MADERSWIDRLFGTGIFFSLLTVGIAFWGIYQAHTKSSEARDQLRDQETLRNELTAQLKNTDKAMNELRDRLVKLETTLAATKVEAQGAALQANVARLQTEYDKPEERARLRDFGLNVGTRQRTFAEILNERPANPSAIGSLPPAPTLPDNLNFLKPNDKTSLESILGKTQQSWSPPAPGLTLPPIDWSKFQKPTPQEEKPILVKAWETVKAYPAVVILLLLVLVGSASKK